MPRFVSIVCLSLLVLMASAIPGQAGELSDALQQQDLQKQQDQAQGGLKQLTFTSDKLTAQIAQLTAQIAAAESDLTQKQATLASAQAAVASVQKELADKQAELDKRRQSLAKRLCGIYKDEQIDYFAIIFQASDLSDFITRLEYTSKLATNDQEILRGIQEERAQVSAKEAELVVKRDQASKMQAQATAAKSALDNKKAQQEKALQETKDAQNEALTDIEKLAADSNALNGKIRQLQAAAKRGVLGTISNWPLPGDTEISSPFGWRTDPLTHTESLHTGVDIPAPSGTEIHAAGAGAVIFSGYYGAYGNTVIIDHGGGYSTLYGHQSKIAVKEDQEVRAGQVIGYVGTTDWSADPHLYFEVRVSGNPTDPLAFYN